MTKQKAGRTNKYDTHVAPKLELIAHWCKQGATEEEICKKLDVGVSTFNKYKKEHPELKDVLFLGKQDADDTVEASLYNNAVGYDYYEEQAIKVKRSEYIDGKKHETEEVQIVEVKKHRPAETVAQIFWLKNRRPNEWRDKQDVKVEGEIKTNSILEDIARQLAEDD